MTVSIDQPRAEPDSPRRAFAACLIDTAGEGLHHAGDLATLLDIRRERWTDALLSETRAHLFGCLNAIELSLGIQLAPGWLAKPVEALGPGYCCRVIEYHPGLLTPLLISHLRQRAAAALLLRAAVNPAVPILADQNEAADDFPHDRQNRALADALAALRLSCDPWHDAHPVHLPMRTDLPVEPYCDLVWIAAALIVEGLVSQMGVETRTALSSIGHAAEVLIARHDEQAGPFARAGYAVAVIGDRAGIKRLANHAAMNRDLLLLAALGAKTGALSIDLAFTLLMEGKASEQVALAHGLGLSAEALAALLVALAIVRADSSDAMIMNTMSLFRAASPDMAQAALACWQGPEPLVGRLAQIKRSRA
jgi:hypothetical protein